MPLPALAVPVFAAKAAKAIGGFFSKITLRQWLYFVALCAILFAGYKGYNAIWDRGSHSRDAEVAQLKLELQTARDEMTKFKEDTKKANKQFAAEQETLRQGLQAKLDLANHKAKQREVIIREMPKYISVADDTMCPIPVNFGLLHNVSIEGQDTSTPDRLSETTTGERGATSSLTLSQYAEVASRNNSEAVRRGAIIEQWEQWYDASEEQFTRAQQSAAEAILEQSHAEAKPEPE